MSAPTPTREEIRRIYAGIEHVPGLSADMQGWNSESPIIRELVTQMRPHIYVEAGVWKGRSLLFAAKLCRELGIDCLCYGVDLWWGLRGMHIGHIPPSQIPPHWNRPTQYEQFLYNVKSAGFDDCVIPVCNFSQFGGRILQAWGVQAQIVNLDAGHEEEFLYSDMTAYWPVLAPGGVMTGDDFSESYPGVERALNRFCAEVRKTFRVVGGHWAIEAK